MRNNPTYGHVGTDGLFEVIIYYDDNPGSIVNWRYFETTAQNVTYEEGLRIERERLDDLVAENK